MEKTMEKTDICAFQADRQDLYQAYQTLLEENCQLRHDNEMLQSIMTQMKRTIDRMIDRYIAAG